MPQRARPSRFNRGMFVVATILAWVLLCASVLLDITWSQHGFSPSGWSVDLDYGSIRLLWLPVDATVLDSDDGASFKIRRSSLLQTDPADINWTFILHPSVRTVDSMFGRYLDVWFPLWIPAMALLLLTVFVVRPGHRHGGGSRCRNCGYDLTGNVSGRCPECGEAIDAATSAERVP